MLTKHHGVVPIQKKAWVFDVGGTSIFTNRPRPFYITFLKYHSLYNSSTPSGISIPFFFTGVSNKTKNIPSRTF